MLREYRAVKCDRCLWQDFYQIGTRPSYPPQCPDCGSPCSHEFFLAEFSFAERSGLGHDFGARSVFGDPRASYQNLRDRRGISVHRGGINLSR